MSVESDDRRYRVSQWVLDLLEINDGEMATGERVITIKDSIQDDDHWGAVFTVQLWNPDETERHDFQVSILEIEPVAVEPPNELPFP